MRFDYENDKMIEINLNYNLNDQNNSADKDLVIVDY
jgi:hypothetical protein